jgi:hypothetical protein
MKSLMLLWKKVAKESATWCCTSATLDCRTVELRVKHEGLSFLTITLPVFAKDFERGLELGQVDRRLFTGFRWKGGLPRFLGGFLDLVFDRGSGVLLDEPSIDAIIAIRQLTLMYNKIALPCSDARERKAMADYVKCELEVRRSDSKLDRDLLTDFARISSILFAGTLSKVDLAVYQGDLVPRHGPGATADTLRGNGKFKQTTWTERLEEILPSGEFLLPNWRFYDQLQTLDFHDPGSEKPVKVISVPKTLKTPRIIAIEPTAMQYAQQALLAEILFALHQDDFLDGVLGFEDQLPNQQMARFGSLSGCLATLDLSEASDRVSNVLVTSMFRNHPFAGKAVDACRSRTARVPGHGVIPLAKFASMGSALTFPIEAMVFLTIISIGIERELNTRFDRRTLVKELRGRVRVYGDDIIVPVEFVRSVISSLEAFGLKVNERKSFWNGKFRESCGKEFYDGSDVSLARFRHEFPTSRRHVQGVIGLVSFRNQMYHLGYWDTCQWLDRKIGKILKYFPVVLPSSPVLGRHSFLGFETQKIDKELHSPLVKGWVVSATSPADKLDGVGALLKFLLRGARQDRFVRFLGWRQNNPELMPSIDGHLERAGRPQTVNIKLRWATST